MSERKYYDPKLASVITLTSINENAALNAKHSYEQMFDVELEEVELVENDGEFHTYQTILGKNPRFIPVENRQTESRLHRF